MGSQKSGAQHSVDETVAAVDTTVLQVFFLFKRELERELVIESLGIYLATEIKTQGLFLTLQEGCCWF